MNQPPKRLLQDTSLDPALRGELSEFGQHCDAAPFDLNAGLARFEATAAAMPAVGASAAAGAGAAKGAAGMGVVAKLLLAGVGLSAGAGALVWGLSFEPSPPTQQMPAQIELQKPDASQLPVQPEAAVAAQKGNAAELPSHAQSADPLAAELALLRKARAALQSKQPKKALQLLRRGEARFRGGSLVQEREALRIIASFRSGKKSSARKDARAFLKAHPESPMASRMRHLLR